MSELYTNADGLTQAYGAVRVPAEGYTRKINTSSLGGTLVVDFDVNNLPSFDEDASGGSTMDSFGDMQAFLPAGAWIQSATLLVKEAIAGGTTPTLTIGTYQKDGTVIDADGIDAAVAAGDLGANAVVKCDGAQVDSTSSLANSGYIVATTSGDPTGGSFKLVIEYMV